MRIKEIISQSRRDFVAIYECEHCLHTFESDGYDDTYFHKEVIPDMKCPKCDRKARAEYSPVSPRYPDWVQL